MKNKKLRFITKTAVIAALYCGLTLVLAPLSYGIIQFRFSEILTVLPMFTSAAIPGLTIGCLLSNYIGMAFSTSAGLIDVIFGTLATLLAALGSYASRRHKFIVPLFPIIFNGLIVGTYLHILVFNTVNIGLCILSVAFGEAVVTYLLGIPLINILQKKIGDLLND